MPDRSKVIDLKEDLGPTIELAVEMVPEGADLAVLDTGPLPAGRAEIDSDEALTVVDGDRAADIVANTEIPIEVGLATADLVAAMPNAVDQFDDMQAAALVARRRLPAGRVHDEVGVPEDPPPPENLPAVFGTSVFAKGTAKPPSVEVRWLKVYDLPGYMVQPIRALGRAIFSGFACFAEQQRDAADRGEDPLGDLQILANINGAGPSRRAELDIIATWIRQGGVPIDATTFEFPGVIPGYMPRVILSVSEDRSFLMVEERRDAGAPADALYIYSWHGGMNFYRRQPALLADLAAKADINPARRRAQPRVPVVRRLGRPAGRVDPAGAAEMATFLTAPATPQPTSKDRRAVRERLPEAPGRDTSGLSNALRRAGYWPHGSQNPPHLRKALDDHRVVDLRIEAGQESLSRWVFEIRSSDGELLVAGSISSIEDLENALTPSAPAP